MNGPASLQADAQQIGQFVSALFRYADEGSYISLRGFDQVDRGIAPILIRGVPVPASADFTSIVDAATRAANQVANNGRPGVFAPPVATFTAERRARTEDLANGVALSVELDGGNSREGLVRLESIIGPVTIAMTSGGEWTDPGTGEIHPKMHLHWRLSEPTRTADEHEMLRQARVAAAMLVGGDMTAGPPAHPLRWPGSWNLKRTPRLSRIVTANDSAEIHLADALERLQVAVEAAGLGIPTDGVKASGPPQAPIEHVVAAVAAIPNDDVSWNDWNRVGMAIFRATGGDQAGLDAWDDWSAKSTKHNGKVCAERWKHYVTSKPTKIGAGTLFMMAAAAGWDRAAAFAPEPPEPDPDDPGYQEPSRQRNTSGDAPEAEQATPRDGSDRPLFFRTFAEAQPQLDVADFVEGVLTQKTMSVVYGESNCGKTFFVSDIAMRVAAGMPWRDRAVEQGVVLYLALEGGFGISNRIAAFREEHGINVANVAFAFVTVAMNLLNPEASSKPIIDAVEAVVAMFNVPLRLIVVDTLSRAMAGGNENAPEDMTALVATGDRIREKTEAHVLWIHHSGKDAARGARGHSSLRAATDTEIEITAEGNSRLARVTKQRDMECSGEFPFTLKVIELGQNRRGKPVTSCVVEHGDGQPSASTSRFKGHTKSAYEVLIDAISESGTQHPSTPPGIRSIPEPWWRQRFYDRAMPKETADTRSKAFRRVSKELIDQHIVALDKGRLWLVGDRTSETAQL